MSLRTRIAAAAGLAVALAVLTAAVIVHEATRSELRGQIDSFLSDRAHPFERATAFGGEGFGPLRAGSVPPPFDAPPPSPYGGPAGSVQLLGPDGTVLRSAAGRVIPVSDEARAIAAAGGGRDFADVRAGGVDLRVLTVGLGPRGALEVARPLTEVDSVLRRQLLLLGLVGIGGIGLAVLLGAAVARTALGPVVAFTRQTESVTGRPDLGRRLEVTGRDELARLAQSINTTLDALERSAEAQRNLVADASHELRTPLASLRANVQLLEDADRLSPDDRASLRADTLQELDELTGLVSDVVELARGRRAATKLDDVRLDELVHRLVERARGRDGGIAWTEELEPTVVRGEGERITRAVSNLLDNARKWSPPGGTVEVRLRDGTLAVRDRGPGFAAADLPHVFDRFYRSDEARRVPGSGLGLAIVREASAAHGGTAEAANATGGGGLVRVSFGRAERPGEGDPAP